MDTSNQQHSETKRQDIVPIPTDLLAFLRKVHSLISGNDNAAMRASDDLLQSECAYGGLITQGGTQYGFTYFPDIDEQQDVEEPPTWELLLDKSEIEDVAVGRQKQLTLSSCQVAECGNKFSDENGQCFQHDDEAETSD